MDESTTHLKRVISLPLIVFYGLGTILGAGIYVLVGKVATLSGIYTPIAFLLSAIIALFTAFSYAELSARFPKSAGEAVYVYQGFRRIWLATLIGWLVVLTGVVSAATLLNGVVGYVQTIVPLPGQVIVTIFALSLGGLAVWGIKESAVIATIVTCIEIVGLLIVLFVARDKLKLGILHIHEIIPPFSYHVWSGIMSGAFLAFYAFIGFEDMVNVAEEIIAPEKTLPTAIFWALGAATLLYVLIAITAVFALPLVELANSKAPLALIISRSKISPALLGVIGSIAVINGALVQIIMASRVIYGMAKKNGAPRFFSRINPVTQTPIIATLFIIFIILLLALWFPLITLAKSTSFIILCIFACVNLSTVVIKLRDSKKESVVSYPIVLPILGFLTCLFFIAFQIEIMSRTI